MLVRTALVLASSVSSWSRLALKNFVMRWICCCIRQQPHDAWSVRHTGHANSPHSRWARLEIRDLKSTRRPSGRFTHSPFSVLGSALPFPPGPPQLYLLSMQKATCSKRRRTTAGREREKQAEDGDDVREGHNTNNSFWMWSLSHLWMPLWPTTKAAEVNCWLKVDHFIYLPHLQLHPASQHSSFFPLFLPLVRCF